jgi:threonine dehydrogenase-like Zn-dependent dehydrogenase
MPFVLGHELVGAVTETGDAVTRVAVGDRIVLHPALGCTVRGIDPPCDACRDGRDALCRNVTRGVIASGIQTGYCKDTGGGFSDHLVAHESQLYKVPEGLPDAAAVLVEPFSCALHGVLRTSIRDSDRVLVIGAGAIGLLTVAALRATGCRARIVAVAKYDHQRQHALGLGADELLDSSGAVAARYAAWAKSLDADVLKPELGKPTVIGGADVVFDCVASSQSIDDGLRFTRAGGTFVLVGMPGVPRGVDWTPMWFKELTVHAAYAYGPERQADGTRDTFDVAIELMSTWGPNLARLVGPPFALTDFRAAFASALNTGQSRTVKTVFSVNEG